MGAMGAEWITQRAAAEIIGCSPGAVERYAAAGLIQRRWPVGRKTPTIDRASAEQFRPWWEAHVAEEERKRLEREARAATSGPPMDGDVWLDSATAALVIGVSAQYVGRLAASERIPATRRRRCWWFRRRDVEQFVAVRALVRARAAGRPVYPGATAA